MDRARAWLGLAVVVLARGLLATVAVMTLWTAVPLLWGWTSVVVVSGSMEPRIRPGDVAVAAPISAAAVRPGHAVLARNPDKPGHLLLHRVIRDNKDGTFTTKGDANRYPDSTPLPASAVRAFPRLLVRYVGLPLLWLDRGEYGRFSAVIAATLLLCVLATRRIVEDDDDSPDGEAPAELTPFTVRVTIDGQESVFHPTAS